MNTPTPNNPLNLPEAFIECLNSTTHEMILSITKSIITGDLMTAMQDYLMLAAQVSFAQKCGISLEGEDASCKILNMLGSKIDLGQVVFTPIKANSATSSTNPIANAGGDRPQSSAA